MIESSWINWDTAIFGQALVQTRRSPAGRCRCHQVSLANAGYWILAGARKQRATVHCMPCDKEMIQKLLRQVDILQSFTTPQNSTKFQQCRNIIFKTPEKLIRVDMYQLLLTFLFHRGFSLQSPRCTRAVLDTGCVADDVSPRSRGPKVPQPLQCGAPRTDRR